MAEQAKIDVVIRAKDEASKHIDELKGRLDKMSAGLRIAGAAFTAAGIAGLKMVGDARKLNAELGQTAITIGSTTGELRKLALETTNVTFQLGSVTKTFDLLARAGVKDTKVMKEAATAFDTFADANNSSAEVMADLLLPALKLFGEEIPTTAEELDKFTWMTKNTLVDMSDFGTLLTRLAPYMDELSLSMGDTIAMLAALGEKGITGTAATIKLRTAITQAASGATDLNTALGLTQEEIDGYKTEMEAATGITQEYADVANDQYTLMDKMKQKFQELSLSAGSFLTPLEPIMAAMTAMGPMMIVLSTNMGAAAVKTGLHVIALIAHKIALVASKIAIIAVTVAQWAWNVAMTANPIGVIIMAVAGLVAIIIGLTKNWDKVAAAMKHVWNWMKDVYAAIKDKVIKAFEWLQNVLGNLGKAFSWIKQVIVDFVKGAIDWMKDRLEALIKPFKIVFDWIRRLIGRSPGIVMLGEEMEEFGVSLPLKQMKDFTESGLKPTVEETLELVDLMQDLIDNVSKLGNTAVTTARKLIKDVLPAFVELNLAVKRCIQWVLDLTDALQNIPRDIHVSVTSHHTSVGGGSTGSGGATDPSGGGCYTGPDKPSLPGETTPPLIPSPPPSTGGGGGIGGGLPFLPFHGGGVMPWDGPANLLRGEIILPPNTLITVPIYLDSELIGEKIIEFVGGKARDRGYRAT